MMYDQLWEESPRVQKMKAQLREQVLKEGKQEGRQEAEQEIKDRTEIEARTFRRALVTMIQARFPNLAEFAQQRVELLDKPAALDLLIQQISMAPDADIARWLLDSSTKMHK